MSFIKLLIISALTFMVSFILQSILGGITEERPFQSHKQFANIDKAYQFNVPEDGQMMRFEISGKMPMNKWKSFDLEIFKDDGSYLFTYQDELWSESGRDSDGPWTEYKKKAFLEQRFAKKGNYSLYLTDSATSNKTTATARYSIRAVPIKGDGSMLQAIKWGSGIIALLCFIVLIYRAEHNKKERGGYLASTPFKKSIVTKNNSTATTFYIVLAIFFIPLTISSILAFKNDDSDIDWLALSYHNKQISIDRELRQQSLSGPAFRTGGSRGGK